MLHFFNWKCRDTSKSCRLQSRKYIHKTTYFTYQLRERKNFSSELNFTSNYVFRGISQTDNQPAAQAALAYSFLTTEIYVSLFGSNDDFLDNHNKTIVYEIDPSVGITNKISDHTIYDINLSRYIYPQSNHISYNELNSYINYYFITAQFSYSNGDYATGKSGNYYNLGFRYEIPSRYFLNLNHIYVSDGIGYSNLPADAGLPHK